MPYDEIAEATARSPAAVLQIAHRAREHVAARRPHREVTVAEQQAVVERFLTGVYVAATRAAPVLVNGAPRPSSGARRHTRGGRHLCRDAGRVTAAYIVRNPHKLRAVEQEAVLTR
ncbi:hypothetical protein ACRTEC_00525 [Janibacter indicus]